MLTAIFSSGRPKRSRAACRMRTLLWWQTYWSTSSAGQPGLLQRLGDQVAEGADGELEHGAPVHAHHAHRQLVGLGELGGKSSSTRGM
jgi:hypothetical protein